MRLLDRYLLMHFLKAYAACFVCLVGLFILLDLFARIDEFTKESDGVLKFCRNVLAYYGCRVPWFFQRLSGLLCLLAGLFTLAWLERQNEVIAWLAAGVPGRRLLVPILLGTMLVIGLSVLNREFVVPACRTHLQRTPDDPFGEKPVLAQGAYDHNRIHLTGAASQPKRKIIEIGHVTLPPEIMGCLVHLRCAEMIYRPARGGDTSGWFLIGTKPEHVACPHPALNWLGPGTYFLHTDVDYDRLTRRTDWFHYEPTHALLASVARGEQLQRRGEMIALVHRRLTEPIWELLLVVLSISLLAGRPERGLMARLGLAFGVNAMLLAVQFLSIGMAQHGLLDASLANWLPLLLVGPLALACWDAIRI
jgi:lipopolysaccharide export system permease protein